MRGWNAITTQRLAPSCGGRERPSPPSPCAAEAKAAIACVRTYRNDGSACAVLPVERCKALLHHVYECRGFAVTRGDPGFDLALCTDGSLFTAKTKGAENFNVQTVPNPGRHPAELFTCVLRLPGVLCCSASVGSSLPVTLPPTEPQLSMAKASNGLGNSTLT